MESNLREELSLCFSSIESLKKQFIATAMSMFSGGFVWLLQNPSARKGNEGFDPQFTILCTYSAGSPLPGAHRRVQTADANIRNAATGEPGAGAAGPYSRSNFDSVPPGGIAVAEPVLGVCTWEHAWIHDHGITSEGKRRYLEGWWDCIDWNIVKSLCLDRNRIKLPSF